MLRYAECNLNNVYKKAEELEKIGYRIVGNGVFRVWKICNRNA